MKPSYSLICSAFCFVSLLELCCETCQNNCAFIPDLQYGILILLSFTTFIIDVGVSKCLVVYLVLYFFFCVCNCENSADAICKKQKYVLEFKIIYYFTADGRDTVSRQGQGGGAQQQPGSHNISHNQLHGISAGNAKGRPVPGPPIIIAKRPPAPIPAFQNQPPSSTVTHSRQHESNSEGLNFSQSQLALVSGSPILNSDRKPIPTPTHNISGPAVVPPLAAGHPSSQFTEQYPGPQHQARPHEYLKFDEAPQEIAPAIPNASPLLPHQGSTKVVQLKLQGGGTFDLLPIFRSLMDQPYFRMISRAKSKDTLETGKNVS